MVMKFSCGAILLAIALAFTTPASAGSKGKGKGKDAPPLRGGTTVQGSFQDHRDRMNRRNKCDRSSADRSGCADDQKSGRVRVIDGRDTVIYNGAFHGLPPGLGKRYTLPGGLAKREYLPPGLAKGHGVPPGLANRRYLPPGLSK